MKTLLPLFVCFGLLLPSYSDPKKEAVAAEEPIPQPEKAKNLVESEDIEDSDLIVEETSSASGTLTEQQ